ncbi:RNA polymerase I associated factor, A49-like protein [Hesseltinella vesiculosa]|uniref:RNA polymerase I associated factor, A49-like protein n=1 Tax=Hesseltinella vesiculosa TaxID=101127 RepID=A0A1X2GW28_9FUNG|nr:RNA polymerase I associated factor, A49-like protein [Hesseltinella vesiculosa]
MGKRKHADAATEGKDKKYTKIKLANVSGETPVLATFPGITPARDIEFTPYKRNYETSEEKANQRVLVADADKVVFQGTNFGASGPHNLNCSYYVGVYSKSKNEVQVVPARLVAMRRHVKASETERVSASKSKLQQRQALGLAFGSRRVKTELRNNERNAVDANKIEDQVTDAMASVERNVASMPTSEQLRKEVAANLPIPVHNVDATTLEEAYDLNSIVTSDELNAIPIKDVFKVTSMEEMQAWLPFGFSKFINNKLYSLISATGKKDRHLARLLVYVSYLMAYYCKVKRNDLTDHERLSKVLKHPPALIIEGLTNRYADGCVLISVFSRSPQMADKILCYMMVLCLMLQDFKVYPDLLATDLSLKASHVTNILRSLGCKIDVCNAEDIIRAGFDPKSKAKKATLVVPLKFPEIKKGGGSRR